MKKISVRHAIFVGQLWVNAPVLPIMFAPIFILVLCIKDSEAWNGPMSSLQFVIFIGSIIVGFILSWLWWSINVPKWRLWSYQRVVNLEALIKASVSAGITWPKNDFFEKTEIKSSLHSRLEKQHEESIFNNRNEL